MSKDDYREEKRILRDAMLEKRLVVFVGAGASIDSGLPSWGKAIEIIADKLGLKSTALDYMKIPQYYYNKYRNKEYVQLMRKIFKFKEDLPVCDVQRNIVRLNTHTIITTNYDNLIEKAAQENAEFIQVISKDNSLSYRSAEKEIIKMHGDFENENFVLREDDYLHYSENFKLIGAYVKSLIATNVVLFIGYSFSDPDVKQIFTWVKDILGKDFQMAYMLEVKKEYDQYEYDYYKNLGINILYASKMYKKFDAKQASTYTNDFLKSIYDGEPNENNIDDLYITSKSYSDLNYVSSYYIAKMFIKYDIYVYDGKIKAIDEKSVGNKLLSKIYKSKGKADIDKVNLIKSIVKRSSINTIEIYKKNGIEQIELKDHNEEKMNIPEMFKCVFDFNFTELRNIREKNENNLNENTPGLYMEQAYISYILFDYLKAYKYLRASSAIFYRKKQYVMYFISEYDRKNVGNLIVHDIYGKYNEQEKEKIRVEINAIDLEIAFEKIPSREIKDKGFLQDLYTCKTLFSTFQRIYLSCMRTEDESRKEYLVHSDDMAYEKLRMEIIDCLKYDMYNYIMVDSYSESIETYRMFAKTIINSYNNSSNLVENPFQERKYIKAQVKELGLFDIYIVVKYMDSSALEELLRPNYKNYIKISDDARKYVINLPQNMSVNNTQESSYFINYLILVGNIELDKQMIKNILKALCDNFDHEFFERRCDYILYILNQAVSADICDYENHYDVITDLISNLLSGDLNVYEGHKDILIQCLKIYEKIYKPYENEKIYSILNMDYFNALAYIYPYVSSKLKCEIKKKCGKWKCEKDQNGFDTYYVLVSNGVIPRKKEIEKKMLNVLETARNENMENPTNEYDNVIRIVIDLYLNHKIIMKEEVVNEVSKSPCEMYKWLINYREFDYTKFQVCWLTICNDKLLDAISQKSYVKEAISKRIKESYIQTGLKDNIIAIYFKYFA